MAIQVDERQADELWHVYSKGEDYCAGFDCAMKDRNKLRNILNLQTQDFLKKLSMTSHFHDHITTDQKQEML